MSLHDDLLKLARKLVHPKRLHPKQATLRRAISTAYYALFHFFVDEAARMLVPDAETRYLVARTFEHTEMNAASRSFAGGTLPFHLHAAAGRSDVPSKLQDLAQLFLELQQARHEADYRLDRDFTREETEDFLNRVHDAWQQWRTIQTEPITRLYLASLLLWKRWKA